VSDNNQDDAVVVTTMIKIVTTMIKMVGDDDGDIRDGRR
jgi:hypothetical protein